MKSVAWILAVALALSVGYNVYQKVSFNRLYWRWGTTLTDRLINSGNRVAELANESDAAMRTAGLKGMMDDGWREIRELGGNLDLMLSRVWPYPDTYLNRIGSDLDVFAIGVWNRSYQPVANVPGPGQPMPTPEELSRLARVFRIYAEQFTEDVVLSQSPGRHRKALQAAHAQIRREGLEELLPDLRRSDVMQPLD